MLTFRSRSEPSVSARSLGAALLLIAALSCSSIVEPPAQPRSGITLLVTNGTCLAGPCDSLRVLGFPSKQPPIPAGLWSLDLGIITTSEVCFTLPPSATFLIIGVRDDGTRDTTTYTWTSADSLALGAQPPSSFRWPASPSTTAFVPATEAGWRITFPTAEQPTPSSVCTP
jgi:hypothetical protein